MGAGARGRAGALAGVLHHVLPHCLVVRLLLTTSPSVQFLAMWDKVKDMQSEELKWGDEVEYGVLSIDEKAGTVACKLRGAEILAELRKRNLAVTDASKGSGHLNDEACSWVPEYGAWMVEGTPAQPYSGFASDLLSVERNMRMRRAQLLAVLQPDEICP